MKNYPACKELTTYRLIRRRISFSLTFNWFKARIYCNYKSCLNPVYRELAQWLSGRVLDSRPKGRGFEPHRRHCVVVLEQDTFNQSLVLNQPRKTSPCLTERLLMGHKESNQTNKTLCTEARLQNLSSTISIV